MYSRIPHLSPGSVLLLEKAIDEIDAGLPVLRTFILPGGNVTIAHCHVARCICRRAERTAVLLAASQTVNPQIIIYLNRLSDYLFMVARKIARDAGIEEVPWKPEKS
jgi:cob(I)alamin adenosyltransferase